jgi:hypothetical protein
VARTQAEINKGAGVEDIESHLRGLFDNVSPNPEYLDRIKVKLQQSPDIVLERQTQSTALLVVGLGLMSGFVLLMILQLLRRLFRPSGD